MPIRTVSLREPGEQCRFIGSESLVNNADRTVSSYVCINLGHQLWYACQRETVYSSGGQNCSGWEKREVRLYWGEGRTLQHLFSQKPVFYDAGGTWLQCSVAMWWEVALSPGSSLAFLS